MHDKSSNEMFSEVMDYIDKNGEDEESMQAILEIDTLTTLEELNNHINFVLTILKDSLNDKDYIKFLSSTVVLFEYIGETTKESCGFPNEKQCTTTIGKLHRDAYKKVAKLLKNCIDNK